MTTSILPKVCAVLVSQAGRVGPTWGFPHVRQQGATLAHNQVGEGRVLVIDVLKNQDFMLQFGLKTFVSRFFFGRGGAV